MKNIFFTISLLLLSFAAQTQSLPLLIEKYEEYCNELVPDTVEQRGTVTYDLVPVKDSKGKVIRYDAANPDTTWQTPECHGYKYYPISGTVSEWNKIKFFNLDDQLYYGPTIPFGTIDSVYIGGHVTEFERKPKKTTVDITRDHICMIKRKPVEPWSQDFWDWIRNCDIIGVTNPSIISTKKQ